MRTIYAVLLLAVSSAVAMAQEDGYVPQVREGVEWGYSCAIVVPGGNVDYLRLQFNGKTTINDREYYNLYRYNSYFLFTQTAPPVAWMREENKKVYAIFNPEYKDLVVNHGCEIYGDFDNQEVLIMDYSLSPDESFTVGTQTSGMTATCLSVEPIMIGDSYRQIFTLSLESEFYGEMGIFKLVEGIGPLSYNFPGAGSFLFPFCMPLVGIGYPQQFDGWLYERTVLPVDTSGGDPDLYIYTMGNISTFSPIFDYCGIHDPTVWYWTEKHGTSTLELKPSESNGIVMKSDNEGLTVSSNTSAITNVQLFQPDGTLIKDIRSTEGIVRVSFSDYSGKMLIVVTNLADGKRDIRKIISHI